MIEDKQRLIDDIVNYQERTDFILNSTQDRDIINEHSAFYLLLVKIKFLLTE